MTYRLNIAVIMTMMLFTFSSCSQDKIKPESDLKKMNVSGDVIAIKETKYSSLEDYNVKRGITELSRFNNQGNKESVQPIYADGSVTYKRVFTYNDNQNLVKEVSLDSDNKPYQEIQYVYDEKGRLLESNHQNDGEFYTKFKYEYDEKGNLILETTYNSDTTVDSKSTFVYNKNNDLIEEKWLYADGGLYVTIKSKYADSGVKIKESRYRSNGNLYMTLEFNKNGEQSSIIDYDPYSKSEIQISTAMRAIEYEYDEFGNWTSQKTLENNKPVFVITREFEYQK